MTQVLSSFCTSDFYSSTSPPHGTHCSSSSLFPPDDFTASLRFSKSALKRQTATCFSLYFISPVHVHQVICSGHLFHSVTLTKVKPKKKNRLHLLLLQWLMKISTSFLSANTWPVTSSRARTVGLGSCSPSLSF